MRNYLALCVGLLVALTGAMNAHAVLITNGFTFAVASNTSNRTVGHHYHSNTGGAFGNPAGKAEVGRYFAEEVRGLSEYSLAGLTNSTSAFVTFEVYNDGGLFSGANDFPFDGTISVYAYAGNNTENISDYQAASTGLVGAFGTSGLVVGNTISMDISSLFNTAIDNGDSSLGIRLQAEPLPGNGAWTFDNFRLTTDDQSTDGVPEPLTASLGLLGMCAAAFSVTRRRH